MDVTKIRADFPLLQNSQVTYFDNACQSMRPQSVIDAITHYYTHQSACSGRSAHSLAASVTKDTEKARATIARFFHAKHSEEIIFTRNTTEGINLVANSLGLTMGDVVVTTDKEHNSNLIPWQIHAKTVGIKHIIVPSLSDNSFDLKAYKQALTGNVKLVSVVYTSNLDGMSIPAREIIQLAHSAGAVVLLDAAQAAPHKAIDVQKLDVDFVALSFHKMCGPSGMGVLYGKKKLLTALSPFMVGGDTVASSTYTSHEFLPIPEKFEAGLQDYAGILGAAAACDYISNVGFDAIYKQEYLINDYLTTELSKIPGLTIIGSSDPRERSGIVSFYIPGKDHHQIALMLSQMNIAVRSGQHCVHSWFHSHNIPGSVRISAYFYNTIEEAQEMVQSIVKIVSVL